MAIVVRRVKTWPNNTHMMSIVVDGSKVQYVLATGAKSSILVPSRARKFAPLFEEINGRKPESPEDWAEAASYNLGMHSSVGSPVGQSYGSAKEAIKAEQDLIDQSIEMQSKPRTLSDDQVAMSDQDELEVMVDPSGAVVALTLDKKFGGKFLTLYRVDGQWSDTSPLSLSEDELEDLNLRRTTMEYIAVYDGGSRSVDDIIDAKEKE